ncbi:MAG TPA: FAD-dependent oxidoreductase [bacterium]|jgi:protoporphyrinogen oxidase|nr:FAD-dependent oxidoreductase [bacterium]
MAEARGLKVAVVGGGLGGLVGALELAKRGHRVTVFEKYPVFGGLASAFALRGTHLERFYHHIFATDLDLLDLVDELKLQDSLVWNKENNANWRAGRTAGISPAWKLLFWGELSLPGRFKLAFWSKWISMQKDWRPYDGVTARDWILAHMGEEVWAVMWEPLFRSKFGAYAEQVSMTWLYGRLSARFGPSKKGAPAGKLGYIMGSTQVVVDALLARLKEAGVELRPSQGVTALAGDGQRVTGVVTRAGEQGFDAVLCTCATPEFLKQAGAVLPEDLRKSLERFRYFGSVVAVLELRGSVTPFYWTSVLDRDQPFLAVIEHTRMIGPENYQGAHLLYAARYLDTADPFFRAPDAEVLKEYYLHLKQVVPGFDPALVEKAHVMRADFTQPIVTTGYGSRVPPHRLPVKGLYLANMTQIFPEDRGMSYSVALGRKAAAIIQEDAALL